MKWKNCDTSPMITALRALTASLRKRLVQIAFIFVLQLPAVPALSAELTVTFHDADGEPLGDVFVTAYRADGSAFPLAGPAVPAEIEQLNKAFHPHVLPVALNTRVSFPNRDRVRHHVYSFSAAKTFELELYQGVPSAPVEFDQAGIVALGCNIHDQMKGFVLVLDTGVHAQSDAQGLAQLDLPQSQAVQLKAWHSRLVGGAWVSLGEVPVGAALAGPYGLDVPPPPPARTPSLLQQRFNRARQAQ